MSDRVLRTGRADPAVFELGLEGGRDLNESATAATKAGFWIRFGAILIDGIILAVIGGILRQILGTGAGGGLSTLISIIYYIYFWTSSGQTPGHQLLHLRVVRTDGSPLDVGAAIIRYVGYVISIIPV